MLIILSYWKRKTQICVPSSKESFVVRALDKYIYTHNCWFNTVYIFIYLRGGNKLKAVLAMGFAGWKLYYFLLSRRVSEAGQPDTCQSWWQGTALAQRCRRGTAGCQEKRWRCPAASLFGAGAGEQRSHLAVPRRGELRLQEGVLQVACSTGRWTWRSWTRLWGAMAGRYMCPSPERYKSLQGLFFKVLGPCSHGGQEELAMASRRRPPWIWDGAFPFTPTSRHPEKHF